MAAKPQPSFSPGRRWKIGGDVIVRTALVLAVVVMANYLGAKFFKRFYLGSETQQLSTRTLSIVHSITNEVKVTVYFDTRDDENFYPTIIALLNEYHSANPKISVKTVDYNRDPGEAQKIKEQYKSLLATDKDVVIFDCNGLVKSVSDGEICEKKLEQVPSKNPEEKYVFRKKPVAFNGEVMFTSMLLAVQNPKPFKAYFLQGNGEPSLSGSGENEYQKFGVALAENFIATVPLTLLGDKAAIPDDCNLLVIAGPRSAFKETELQKIDQYLKQGGRLFAMFNFLTITNPTGLETILKNWGVNVVADVVKEPNNTYTGADAIIYEFTSHPAVNPLTGLPLEMVLPRPVARVDWQNPPADAPKVDEIAFSSPQSTLVGYPSLPPQKYPMIVAVERKAVPGVANTRGATRIIVAGDSTFLDNQMIAFPPNRDFAGYAVNWLLDRTVLLEGIGPRPVKEFRLTMSRAQQKNIRWILLAALPGGVLTFGWLVWLVRRK